ncbi:MAG: energy transducer TonB [Myxococcales bacterium]|nr:energy transducer TonB [Myxococcota bacterium]MDW8281583.1 energy transducer TonB [Myxococcales bacterium]
MTDLRPAERDYLGTGVALALLVHAGVALAALLIQPEPPRPQRVVEVEIRQPPPPSLTPPVPEPAPEPARKIVKQAQRPPQAPRPTRVADKPPETPPVPVFGLSDKDTVAESGVALPAGNTLMADPGTRGPVSPLPPAEVPGGQDYHPVSEAELKRLPEHDAEACGASMREKYSASQAYAEGIEGEVVFRIELDERGNIRGIRKIKGLGHGLDEMAMGYLRFNPRCRFRPAIGRDGRPAAFVIERYSVIFEAAR